ncbi:MAG: molybdopterin molybdotransferase MoeA [Phycisphaerales bacterium]|nr:MAG: molybdopterin molybdotransferase MoeA [Phycisphaerales bacterium]
MPDTIPNPPQLDHPNEAIAAFQGATRPVGVSQSPLGAAAGRVLARPILADRDSPPLTVSSMDGFAVRAAELSGQDVSLPIAVTCHIGRPCEILPKGSVARIVTGAPMPEGADTVVPKENAIESDHVFRLRPDAPPLVRDSFVRHRGENAKTGDKILTPGEPLMPANIAAAAAFGANTIDIHERVRVAVVITGDELATHDGTIEPWTIRDSNSATLTAMFSTLPWIEWVGVCRVADTLTAVRAGLENALESADAIIVTGGVSMGESDHVPAAIREINATTLFHRISQRPGKPMLGAVTSTGVPIFALPGNPVSVAVTSRRIVLPALAHRAGITRMPAPAAVSLDNPDHKSLHLVWHRPVRFTSAGHAELIPTQGSGDIVSIARSDGFIEIPMQTPSAAGPWPFYPWT